MYIKRKLQNWINNLLSNEPEKRKTVDKIRTRFSATLEITEVVCDLLNKTGMTREELAAEVGWTKRKLNRWLDGADNLKLHDIADILHVFGCEISVQAKPCPELTGAITYGSSNIVAENVVYASEIPCS